MPIPPQLLLFGNYVTFLCLLARVRKMPYICTRNQETSNHNKKRTRTMKQIETIKTGKNYSAVSVGRLNEIIEHVLPMGPDVTIQGKVFAGQAVGATGSELSFQTLVPGQDSGFLHTHKTHEELYIILKGEGQYQVDGETFPVSEGTIVRVAPDGKRALKNTGSENLTMLCIQYKANAFTEADSPMNDGVILQEELKW